MLQTLDVLIGFTLVMLVMSMAVTMVTQFLGTNLANMKGLALREGIARLLRMLGGGLTLGDSRKIAEHVLRDPLIGQPKWLSKGCKLADTVHREELVKLILEFAKDGDKSKANADKVADKAQLKHRLRASLARNGIENPGEVLEAIRGATLELERTNPELSNSMRAAAAVLAHATSEFLAKLNNWFDQTIDRVVDLFTVRIRIVTFMVSLALALIFQLNSFSLINRLSVDHELRNELVGAAIERAKAAPADAAAQPGARAAAPQALAPPDAPEAAEPGPQALAPPDPPEADEPGPEGDPTAAPNPVPAPAPGAAATSGGTAAQDQCIAPPPGSPPADLKQAVRDCVGDLEDFGLIAFPKSWAEWQKGWESEGILENIFSLQLIGILLTSALLSLGAPFWYSLLRNLIRLRSVVARRDDFERIERQTTQPAAVVVEAPPPAARAKRRAR